MDLSTSWVVLAVVKFMMVSRLSLCAQTSACVDMGTSLGGPSSIAAIYDFSVPMTLEFSL